MQILNKSSIRIKRFIKFTNISNFILSILLIIAIGIFFASVIITQLMQKNAQSVNSLNSSIQQGTKQISGIIKSISGSGLNISNVISNVEQSVSNISSEIQQVIAICLKTFYYITLIICLILFAKLSLTALNIFAKFFILFKLRMRYKIVFITSMFIDIAQLTIICVLIVLFLSVGFFQKSNIGNLAFVNNFFNEIRQIMTNKPTSTIPTIPMINYLLSFLLAGFLLVADILNTILKWISLRTKCFKDKNKNNFFSGKANENKQLNPAK